MIRKVIALTGSAGLAAVLSLGATAASASVRVHPDNTGSCGTSCVEPYFLSSGHRWVQDVTSGTAKTFVGLANRTTLNFGEDWLPSDQNTVIPEFCPGIPTDDPGQPAIDPLFTANQCAALVHANLENDTAWQLRYEPLGTYTGLCSSTYNNGKPKAGARVRLAECGDTASSVWIADEAHSVGSTVPYINGGSNNFSDPLVIREMSGAPAAQFLNMEPENVDSHGIVDSNELVGLLPGL